MAGLKMKMSQTAMKYDFHIIFMFKFKSFKNPTKNIEFLVLNI